MHERIRRRRDSVLGDRGGDQRRLLADTLSELDRIVLAVESLSNQPGFEFARAHLAAILEIKRLLRGQTQLAALDARGLFALSAALLNISEALRRTSEMIVVGRASEIIGRMAISADE